MQFYALVAEWPDESVVFFRALPGCFSSAATTAEALQNAPEAITRYFRWLKENEVVLLEEEITSIEVVVQEHLVGSDANVGLLFETDHTAPDDLEIDNALNIAATARALIIEFMSKIPTSLHNAIPVQGGWSLAQHLQHVMEGEAWFMSHIQAQLPEKQPTLPMSVDDISMQLFENAIDNEVILRNLTSEQRSHIFVHGPQTWTAAKMLRGMTHHLREHYIWMTEIAQQLSSTNEA